MCVYFPPGMVFLVWLADLKLIQHFWDELESQFFYVGSVCFNELLYGCRVSILSALYFFVWQKPFQTF